MVGVADERLDGGSDRGAVRRGEVVRRAAGSWTPAVHGLLAFLADNGFAGAPRPVRITADGVEEVSYLAGETVGAQRPWPAWTHSDQALLDVAGWLRGYHDLVSRFRPPSDAIWRESHAGIGPGVIIAHNDAAPYNAVWQQDGHLVGFVDWDMAGPRHRDDDLAWTAFSWVPLHARHVVTGEGFEEFGRRRERLAAFLQGYGSPLSCDEVLSHVDVLLDAQVRLMRDRAGKGDETYRQMLMAGRDLDLHTAQAELSTI